jgi:hypothetical protein
MGWRPFQAATSCGHKGRARLDALRSGLASREAPKPVAIARCCGVVAYCAEARTTNAEALSNRPETSADQLVMRLVWLGLCAFTRSLTALISSSLWLR